MKDKHPVWVTGIGLLSSHGEGPDAHWAAMQGGKPTNVDTSSFAPYPIHALPETDWATQISRRDMRQMEPWQQIGTYAAGLALEDAGAKGNEDLCGVMDMIVAAGGGERDLEVDTTVMNEARTANDRDAMLNERLSNDLRPTLFLAQLSNLLAGNISIVHKVTGSSRTFMGEEGAGVSAIQTAHARIAGGQSDIVLVGGGYNAAREDMLLLFELGGYLTHDDWAPVWSRKDNPGFALGSMGAFLVMESAEHARKRGAKPYAELKDVAGTHGPRGEGRLAKRLSDALAGMNVPSNSAVLSGASGATNATATETNFLQSAFPEAPIRAFGSVFGHGVEAQFPLGIALAALAMQRGEFCAPFEAAEREASEPLDSIFVTGVGHYRAEGLGHVVAVKDEETAG
ncbi:MAG: beta-ketoacyl-ACP synthase [Ahrensia sp.]|nr:beta-ketoacyl-ACP synthase [Ahrensia sp.]